MNEDSIIPSRRGRVLKVCLTKATFEQLYPQMDVYTCLCAQCMWREDCYYRKPQFTEKTEDGE